MEGSSMTKCTGTKNIIFLNSDTNIDCIRYREHQLHVFPPIHEGVVYSFQMNSIFK